MLRLLAILIAVFLAGGMAPVAVPTSDPVVKLSGGWAEIDRPLVITDGGGRIGGGQSAIEWKPKKENK